MIEILRIYSEGFLENVTIEEPVEKLILLRLIKNAQMQGARNPEE
jgi:hypothetical protein